MVEGILQIEVDKLKHHTRNEMIYGDEDVSDLVTQIEAIGRIIEPLKIKADYTIISGHRRLKAARELDYKTVPCEYVSFDSPEEELAALVLYNYKRVKTNEQKARKGIALFETLSEEAVKRRLANLNKSHTEMDEGTISDTDDDNLDPDSPNTSSKSEVGLTRDKVAEAVGIKSGRTFDRMREVIERVDELKKNGNTDDSELYIAVLNRTPTAARNLLDVSIELLTDEDREDIKTGKAAPRKFLSKDKTDKAIHGKALQKKIMKEIDNTNCSIQALTESLTTSSLDLSDNDILEKWRTSIYEGSQKLQGLLSVIEAELEKIKEEQAPMPDSE